jgi:TPR repeat protein
MEQNRDGAVRILQLVPKDASCFSEALYMLGMAYYFGYGIDENEASAFASLTQAAAFGHAEAVYNNIMLATLYQHGYGCNRDTPMSEKLFKQSAAKGCARARETVEVLSAGPRPS